MGTKRLLVLSVAICASVAASAQQWSVGTNLADYLNLGTLNAELQFAAARHVSFDVQARYNPWQFGTGEPGVCLQSRRQCYSIGIKYWPRVSYAGWFITCAGQWQEFSRSGFRKFVPNIENNAIEGWDAGLVIGAGYMHMISPRLNLDFALDAWGGYEDYHAYSFEDKDIIFRSGQRLFLLPCNVHIGISYLFGRKPGFKRDDK